VCRAASAALAAGSSAPGTLALQASQLEAVLRLAPPAGPVEPTMLVYSAVAPGAAAASGGRPGRILAPRAVKPAFVKAALPVVVRPGKAVAVDVILPADAYPTHEDADLAAGLSALLFHLCIEVSIVSSGGGGAGGVPLRASAAAAAAVVASDRCVRVTFDVPPDAATRGDAIAVTKLTVSGRTVPAAGIPPPAPFLTAGGMAAPLRLPLAGTVNATPAISGAGELFAPAYDSPAVSVFSPEGAPLPPVDVAECGLSRFTRAAAVCDATGTLVLSDFNGDAGSRVAAVDLRNRTPRWTTEPGAAPQCCDVAVLSAAGVVIAGSKAKGELLAFSLRDGKRVLPSAAAAVAVASPRFLAADQASGSVYVSTRDTAVSAWVWNAAAQRLQSGGLVEGAGEVGSARPLAVVPPAPGKRTSYLVVGTVDTGSLIVLSLPDRHVVHRAELDGGCRVTGLAGDPTGTALAVCDGASQTIRVLPWPLPGMPTPV
jgi:DNA-binding beta-propeller fold protein YncE